MQPIIPTRIRNEKHTTPIETKLHQMRHDVPHIIVALVIEPGECVFFAVMEGSIIRPGGVDDAAFVGVAFEGANVRVEGEGGSIDGF